MTSIASTGKMPKQRVPISAKTKEWFKECAIAGLSIALDAKNSIRPTNAEMVRNFRIYDGLPNTKDLIKKFDTFGIVNANYNPTFSTYSTIRNQINLLVGEFIERGEEYNIACLDTESVNSKLEQKTQKAMEAIAAIIQEGLMDEEKIKERLEDIQASKFRSKEELAANKALDFYKAYNGIDYLKVDALLDLLIAGWFVFAVDNVNGTLTIRRPNVLKIFPVRNGKSNDIRDSELIAEIRYLNKAAIIDEFGEELSDADTKAILDDAIDGAGLVNSMSRNAEEARKGLVFNNQDDLEYFTRGGDDNCTNVTDEDDNIRVARIVWAGYRKIYKRKYYDQNADVAYDYVSEFYKAKVEEGEVLTQLWVKEWHESTIIGSNIVTKARVKDEQYRSKTNPFECYSGYVGRFASVAENQAKSLVDLVFPLLYLRDMTFARIEDIMAKNIGKVIELDLSKKPKDWSIKKWLFWVKTHGIKVVDSFNEGDKGMSMGKIAGSYSTSARPIDMDISAQIGTYLQWIQYLDSEINRMTGIPEQRMGAIGQRDAVANVEASRVSSSLVTELWYNVFERGIIDLYELIVEASKEDIGTDKKLQAVLDDYSYSILNTSDADYRFSEIGIFPIKSRKFAKLRQVIEQIAINAVPNGQMSSTQLFNLYRSNNIFEMMDKQEKIERENMKKAQAAREQEMQAQQQQIEAQNQAMMQAKKMDFNHQIAMEQAKGDIQVRMEEIKSQTRIKEIELVNAAKYDADQDGIDDTVEMLKARMEAEGKKADRLLKEKEMLMQNEIKKNELKLKEKELDVRVAEIKKANQNQSKNG